MKQRSYKQVEAAKRKAELAAFNLMGDEDRAEDFSDMSVEEYAQLRGIEIINPHRGGTSMAAKLSLSDQVRQLKEQLQEAEGRILELETEREDVLDALGIEVVEEEDEEDEEDEDEDEEEE